MWKYSRLRNFLLREAGRSPFMKFCRAGLYAVDERGVDTTDHPAVFTNRQQAVYIVATNAVRVNKKYTTRA
jgi:hypothetical protein